MRDSEFEVIDLVCMSSICINAKVEDLWAYIVDTNRWKMGYKLIPISGRGDRSGDIFHLFPNGERDKAAAVVVNVDVDRYRLRTIKIKRFDTNQLMGYATWRLSVVPCGVILEYHVTMEDYFQSDRYENDNNFRNAKLVRYDESLSRFKDELLFLKKLIEEGVS